MEPVSWDYRFSNLCNFKCRMCGDMLSSSWETEERQHEMVDWHNPKNNWMRPEIKNQIELFQSTQIEQEFAQAVEEHRVEEVYWVGGEPLMYKEHWKYMQRIIELGDGGKVYARYNTNLSRTNYRGCDLFSDILPRLQDWQICASLDGTGAIGEYIRTGLNYEEWLENFKRGVSIADARNRRQMRIDFTLTLPGMFEVVPIFKLADDLNVDILAKVVFSFSPDIVLSPLALPRPILDKWIDELVITDYTNNRGESNRLWSPMTDVLNQLKNRPTFEEQYGEEAYREGLAKGKARVLQLEKIRTQSITMDEILSKRPDVYEWWNQIS